METYEMVKELTEHSDKEFRSGEGKNEMIADRIGQNIRFKYTDEDISVNKVSIKRQWEEVKEPVTFMEAVESGKYICVDHEKMTDAGKTLFSEYNNLSSILYLLTKHFSVSIVRDILLNGKWYIE